MLSAILNRRSIRKYKDNCVDKEVIEKILQAGILAPSSKNRQPWKFIVVMKNAKADMLQAMEKGLKREKENPFLAESVCFHSGAEYTLQIMKQAPIIILVINVLGVDIHRTLNSEERVYEICNAQSIGAAMENMTLTATEYGLGSLWICDTYFAYDELKDWLNTDGELIAAMAIGYADETPSARPRNDLKNVIEWRV